MGIEELIRQIVRDEIDRFLSDRAARLAPQVTLDERWDGPIAVSVKEAAQMLGIKPTRAYELVHAGVIPVLKLGPRCWRVPVAELRRRVNEMAAAGGSGSHSAD